MFSPLAKVNFLTRKSVPLSGYSVPAERMTKPIQNPLAKAEKILVLDEHPLPATGKIRDFGSD